MPPIPRIIWGLIRNPTYVCCLIAITNILFVMIACQYNVTNYLINVLNGNPVVVYSTFSLLTLTAPIAGSLCGGAITTKIFGSYANKNTVILCFGMQVAFMISCICNSYIENYIAFMAVFWFDLFTQAFLQPVLTGILLSTVVPVERPVASSFQQFFEYICGLFPAPFFFDVINQATQVTVGIFNVSRIGMRATLFMSIIGATSLLFAVIFRNHNQRKEQGTEDKTIKTNQIGFKP